MMVRLDNLHAHVVTATEAEMAWIDSFLSFEEGARFYKDRRTRQTKAAPPRVRRLFDVLTRTFPAGLTSTVVREGAAKGIRVDVLDERVRPCEPDAGADLSWLDERPFQRECVETFQKKTRGIAWLSTGSGKTEIAVATALSLPTHWLFLSGEKDLLHNAARRWELRTSMDAGRVGDGIWEPDPNERFTSATFQTLVKRLEKRDTEARALIGSVGGVIFDEVHTLPAATFYAVSLQIPNAYYRFGLSGTPLARDDRKSLFAIAATGAIIYRVAPEVLIADGHIARPTIEMTPFRHDDGKSFASYESAYTSGIVKSKRRNAAIVDVAMRCRKPGLVFVRRLEHGRILTDALRKAGVNVEFVWGNTPTPQRDEAIRKLRWGDVDLIVCSVVFQTGTDIPELESIVVSSAGKSTIAALQRVGRGMRVVKDKDGNVIKDTVTVHDVLDRGQKWLAAHANARQRSYMGEGYAVTIAPEWSGDARASSPVQGTLRRG